MTKIRISSCAIFCCLIIMLLLSISGTATAGVAARYRLYNPNDGNHHYTTSQGEYDYLGTIGWNPEGISCHTYDSVNTIDSVDSVPYYRLYNPNNGEHHYTTNVNEYNMLGPLGWNQEGVDGYVYASLVTGSQPLYRVYNPNSGLHHWTRDYGERSALVGYGWRDEGIACYVFDFTVNGTASAGAPIIGSVTIKDSTTPTAQTKTVTIEANGKYTVDVTGLQAPYMLRADGYVGGNEYHLYSAGTSEDVGGTINVTPLTDLIVANIAGSVAKTYFDNDSFSGLTAAELTEQADALKAKLLPVLQAVGVSGSIDLLRASFSTDHTGLDAALDIIRVNTTDATTGAATITNIITNQTISSATSEVLTETTGVAAGVTDIQAISAGFKRFTALFATSLPSETNATLVGLFDNATFLDDGQNLASFLSEITTDQSMIGTSCDNISIQCIDVTNGTGVVTFTVLQTGAIQKDAPESWNMVKRNDVWYLQGNQRIAHVSVKPRAEYQPSSTPATITTGLQISIEDRGGQGITSAVVTGKGLPSQGLIMDNQINYDWFSIRGSTYGTNFYTMDDTQIAAIGVSGEVYTIKLYKGSELAGTYTEEIKKRPYLSTELTAGMFPTITAPSLVALRAFNGGAITVSWTLPSGLINDWLEVTLSDSTFSNTARAEYSPLPTDTSKYFDLPATSINGPFTPANRSVWLSAWDSSDRRQLTIGIW